MITYLLLDLKFSTWRKLQNMLILRIDGHYIYFVEDKDISQ